MHCGPLAFLHSTSRASGISPRIPENASESLESMIWGRIRFEVYLPCKTLVDRKTASACSIDLVNFYILDRLGESAALSAERNSNHRSTSRLQT